MKNPWKKLKSTIKYQNNWLKVYHDDVIRPDKKKGIYGLVKTKGGVGVVAINKNKEIFLVSQFRYAPNVYSLEIPKGTFNTFSHKEDALATAKRELKEEIGVTARKWVKLGVVHTLMGYSDDGVHLFLARDLTITKSSLEGTEDIKVFKVPFFKIEKVIKSGLILDKIKVKMTDATSMAAIFLAKSLIKK